MHTRQRAAPAAPDSGGPRPGRYRALMPAVLLAAWFLAQFDFFVVNLAADSFRRELGAGPEALELIVGGYAFSYAAGMITGGRLGDRFGHRRLFVAGVAAFTVTSLLCGLAPSAPVLVAARLLQGLAGAAMVPQVLALITAVYPPGARAGVLGWYGVTGGAGSIAGQVLGGLLLQANVLGLGWRVVFLVNVPVGIVTALLAWRLLPEPRRGRPGGQDPVGAVALAGCLALVLVPLSLGRTAGWPWWTWLSMALSLPVAAFVVHWLRRAAGRGRPPVVDLRLFRSASYVAGIGAAIAFMAYFASFVFTLSLLLQGGYGLDALRAGLVFAPMGVLFALTAVLSPRLVARYGPVVTVLGGCATALGLLALVLVLYVSGVPGGLGPVIAALCLVGLGNGLVLPRLIGISLVDVRPEQAGVGAAVLTTAQQFAGAAGVAVIGGVFFAVAGPDGDVAAGMRVAALIAAGLIVVVTLLVAGPLRAPDRRRAARPGGGNT